jgi:hypothetical protein
MEMRRRNRESSPSDLEGIDKFEHLNLNICFEIRISDFEFFKEVKVQR